MEKTTLSSCEETTVKDKADDLRVANTISRVEEGFGTRLLETSGDEGVSIIEACMIEEDNVCNAYRVDDGATNDKVKEVSVNNATRVDENHDETSSTLDPETWAFSICKTQETEGGGEEAKVKTSTNNLAVEAAKGSTTKTNKEDIWIPPHLF